MENILPRISSEYRGVPLYTPDPVEQSLIERAKHDPVAFGELFEKYYDPIYRYILHRTADIDLAKDITSETFEIVINKLWTFKWKNIPFSAWLFRIASNAVNGYFRKNKRRPQKDLEEFVEILSQESDAADFELNEYESELAQKKLFLELHKSINKLKPNYQEVIVLRYFEKKSIREISVIIGKSEGTVKSLIHRAQDYLVRYINPELLGEAENE